MESQGPEIIKVHPKSRFLTAEELLALRGMEGGSPKTGQKKTKPSGTEEEKAELDRLYDELKKQLSCPRIERMSARTVAEWDSEKRAVRVMKKEGKFQTFGYTEDKVLYLENHEALFLLEMNRLELYFKTVLMSIEQAYVILLGAESSKTYDNYLVYSTLSRAGYIVQSHKHVPFKISVSDEDCIWEILLSSLDEYHRTPSYIKNYEKYETVKNSMTAINEKIAKPDDPEKVLKRDPISPEDYIDFDKKFPVKRKIAPNHGNAQQFKKPRIRSNSVARSSSGSYLNTLKSDPDYEKFRKIFKKCDVIHLKSHQDFDEEGRNLEINFDLYLPNESFRKSDPDPPVLRVIVLRSSEDFPTRSELTKAYHKQQYKVPLVVISVSESKHIQAFLYHFT